LFIVRFLQLKARVVNITVLLLLSIVSVILKVRVVNITVLLLLSIVSVILKVRVVNITVLLLLSIVSVILSRVFFGNIRYPYFCRQVH